MAATVKRKSERGRRQDWVQDGGELISNDDLTLIFLSFISPMRRSGSLSASSGDVFQSVVLAGTSRI